jgi:transposase
MFVRKKPLYGGKIAVQICESYREQGKVRQRVLRHVGTVDRKDAEVLAKLIETSTFIKGELESQKEKSALEIEPNLPIVMPEKSVLQPCPEKEAQSSHEEEEHHWVDTAKLSEDSRVVEGIHAVFGSVLDKFGLQSLLGIRQYDVLRHIVMARVAWPSSKLRASENLSRHFNTDISVDRMYRLMDILEDQEACIQGALFNAFRPLIGEKVEVLFFDVTTLYFESVDEDELRRFGFSKDQKTHLTQVVLALATTQEGLPVGYKLFPGNTAETSTLLQAIDEWQKSLCIEKITIIADRAMMSDKNMTLLEASGLKYVIAAKLKLFPKQMQKTILARTNEKILFQNEEDTVAVQEHLYENRRLIVSHSTKRARKDARDREQILTKLKKTIGQEGSTKKLVTNRGYLSVVTETGNSKIKIDDEKVAAAARWDGLHGVITNIEDVSHQEILGLYRRLWVIEESFRINKHTLEMRPVYHHASRRIKAHILLCYITFALCRYVQKRISMQHENLSIDRIRSTLIDVQYSILKHEETQSKYRLPSKMSMEARQIYGVFNLKRGKRITKMV